MKKIGFILLSLIVLSCNSNPIDRKTRLDKKVDPIKSNSKQETIVKGHSKEKINKADSSFKNIIGMWALAGSKNVTFQIDKKTFYYPEHSMSYNYKVIGDSIKVHYDGFNQSFAFKLSGNNVLYLSGEDGDFKYNRIKK